MTAPLTASDPRHALVAASRELVRLGLNQGTSGNVSLRTAEGMFITPSGVPPQELSAAAIAALAISGDTPPFQTGHPKPSSEWRLHRDILLARPDVGAVVHTHSLYATVLATQHRDIPALHYMIAAFAGTTIRCCPYAPFGTQALSDFVVTYLGDRHGVLLGNHGMVATGATLEQAIWRASELETLAKMYFLASAGGAAPVLLSDEEIIATIARFASYGMTARA